MELLSSFTGTVLELAGQTVHLSHVYAFFQKNEGGDAQRGVEGAMGLEKC